MKVFAYPYGVPPQIRDPAVHIDFLNQFKVLNDKFKFDGILIFSGLNDAYDTWDLGSLIARGSQQIPVVAMMPNWEHPVITARKIVTFQQLYDRPLAINWITGLALRDYQKLGINLSKQERYDKLGEYYFIVKQLITNTSNKPVTFQGKYFSVIEHKLTKLPKHPVYHYFSGVSSEADGFMSRFPEVMQVAMGMPPGYAYGPNIRGIGLGMFARPTEAEAIEAFQAALKIDKTSEIYSRLMKGVTDSHWKNELFKGMENREGEGGFYSSALLSYSELGFLVNSYEGAARYFQALRDRNIDTYLLQLYNPEEVAHARRVFDLVRG